MTSWIKNKLSTLQRKIQNHKSLYWMENWLKSHPSLWKITKHSVAGGVAVGLFVGFIPLPVQMVLAAVLAIVVRVNLPVAILSTWIIYPFAFLPANYLVYKTGEYISYTNHGTTSPIKKLTFDWHNFHQTYNSLLEWLGSVGKLYLIGFPIVSVSIAFFGYLTVFLVWTFYEKFVQRKKKS